MTTKEIKFAKYINGYASGTSRLRITCYADGATAVSIADSEGDLQRLVFEFNKK